MCVVIDFGSVFSHATIDLREDEFGFTQTEADRGQPWAQVELGQVHLFGMRGRPQNHQEAAQLFQRAGI